MSRPPSYTPEGWGAYGQGYADSHREARIAAFGAIRRALVEVRRRDAFCRQWDIDSQEYRAVRQAIRAAIGSEKAHDIPCVWTKNRT